MAQEYGGLLILVQIGTHTKHLIVGCCSRTYAKTISRDFVIVTNDRVFPSYREVGASFINAVLFSVGDFRVSEFFFSRSY